MEIWRCRFKKLETDGGITIVTYQEKTYKDGLIWVVGRAAAHANEYGLEIVSLIAVDRMPEHETEC